MELINDILDRSISPATQDNKANDKHHSIKHTKRYIPRILIPLSLLNEIEPKQRWKIERESRDERRQVSLDFIATCTKRL